VKSSSGAKNNQKNPNFFSFPIKQNANLHPIYQRAMSKIKIVVSFFAIYYLLFAI